MTTESHPSTARIYTFPDRRGSNGRTAGSTAAAGTLSSASGKRVVSGAWYHEEAIASAERQPKR